MGKRKKRSLEAEQFAQLLTEGLSLSGHNLFLCSEGSNYQLIIGYKSSPRTL